VAPRLAPSLGALGLAKALVLTLTAGLVWQCGLTAALVAREQRLLRWSTLRQALWLNAPQNPRTGRRGGRLWWILLPLGVGFGAEELIPTLPHPAGRDFGLVLSSPAGEAWLQGAWGWLAVIMVLLVCNTVTGEELLFRGYLLPRMTGRFGRWAWLVNGVGFATYHLHTPWAIPTVLLDALVISLPSQRYRSALIGIIVHSTQSLMLAVAITVLVLG
jgi:membrane protease YdiL (CAAX protease family)